MVVELGRVLKEGALSGVRVVDFTWVRAGPQTTRILSMFGAEVIRVEWPDSADTIRHAAPARGVAPSLNSGVDFNNFACNKLSATLNVRSSKGMDLVKELISVSDVVIENFSSRILEKWGLGYEQLKEVNPTVVYVSMAGFGHRGRHRDYDTWGPAVQAVSGLTFMSGAPGKPPAGWGYSYMDHTGGYYGAMAVLAALHYRHESGRGQYVDLAQVDVGCTLTGAAFLDYSVNGRKSDREGMPPGNRTYWPGASLANTYRGPHAAPHNSYKCKGSDPHAWCVIVCYTDEEWRALVKAMGDPEWAHDAKYDTLLGRLEHQEAMDLKIEGWTKERNKYEVMAKLQAAGVASAPVQSMVDRAENDPQLQHRGTFTASTSHPLLGEKIFEGMPMQLRNAPWELWRHGPTIGEDNDYVFDDLLGMRSGERDALEGENVFWPKGMQRKAAS